MKENIKYQKAYLLSKYVTISQGSLNNVYWYNNKTGKRDIKASHWGRLAIDSAGGNSQANNIYAPADGIITFIDYDYKSRVYISHKNVISPTGETLDQLTSYIYHNIPFDQFKVGSEVKQGQYIMDEGKNCEPGGKAYGYHAHYELLLTEFRTNPRQSVKPEDWLFLKRGYHIFVKNDSDYHFYWEGDVQDKNKDQLRIKKPKIEIRKSTDENSTILGYAEVAYFDILETKEVNSIKWYKIYENMWIKANNGLKVISKQDAITEKPSEPIKEPKLKEFGTTKDGKTIYLEL